MDNIDSSVAGMTVEATAASKSDFGAGVIASNRYDLELRDKQGNLKWREHILNLVTQAGIDEMLGRFWAGKDYTAQFFIVLLKTNATVTAADRMDDHNGWTEIVSYDEETRPELFFGEPESGYIFNDKNPCVITLNEDSVIIAGMAICTSPIKGGEDGLMISGGAFKKGDKFCDDGDTLTIKCRMSQKSG